MSHVKLPLKTHHGTGDYQMRQLARVVSTWMSGLMKDSVRVQRFNDNDEVKVALKMWIQTVKQGFMVGFNVDSNSLLLAKITLSSTSVLRKICSKNMYNFTDVCQLL